MFLPTALPGQGVFLDTESMCLETLTHRVIPIGKESPIQEENRIRQVHSLLFQGCKESRVQETCSDSDRKINSYLHMEDKVQEEFGNEMSVAVLLEE